MKLGKKEETKEEQAEVRTESRKSRRELSSTEEAADRLRKEQAEKEAKAIEAAQKAEEEAAAEAAKIKEQLAARPRRARRGPSRKRNVLIELSKVFKEEGKVLTYKEYKAIYKRGMIRPDRVKYIWGSWNRALDKIRKEDPLGIMEEVDDTRFSSNRKALVDSQRQERFQEESRNAETEAVKERLAEEMKAKLEEAAKKEADKEKVNE